MRSPQGPTKQEEGGTNTSNQKETPPKKPDPSKGSQTEKWGNSTPRGELPISAPQQLSRPSYSRPPQKGEAERLQPRITKIPTNPNYMVAENPSCLSSTSSLFEGGKLLGRPALLQKNVEAKQVRSSFENCVVRRNLHLNVGINLQRLV